MALQRGTPIDPRLQMLDVSPALQAGALELQSMVNLNESIQGAVQNFQEKQEEKKQKKMTISALEELVPGMSKEFYTAAAGNKDLQSSLIDAEVARKKAEDQRLTQGAYYLSQFPQEQREDLAEELGLPLPPEPEVIPFDIGGFETRITGAGNKKLAEQLDAIKQNPDNPQNATALELLGMPADTIPSYLESLKAARTEALVTPTPTEEVVTEEPNDSVAESLLYSPVVEAPLKLGADVLGQFVDVPSALMNLARPESKKYKTVYTPDAPVTPSLGSEGLKQILSRTRESLIVPTLKALGFIED